MIEEHIEDALAKGAIDSTPDNESFHASHGDGNFVYPRLLTNVDHTMLVMTDETFGPVGFSRDRLFTAKLTDSRSFPS